MKRLFCIKEYKELNRNFSFLNCTGLNESDNSDGIVGNVYGTQDPWN